MLYSKILENGFLPLGDRILGTSLISELKLWRKLQWLKRDELESLTRAGLARVLAHARDNVPYYQRRQIAHSDDPYLLLNNFPVMQKPVVKQHLDELVIRPRSELMKFSSSGSSGIRMDIYRSKHEHSVTQAIQMLWWEWAGYHFGDSLVQTGITPDRGVVKAIKDRLLRTDYLLAFSMSETEILAKLRELAREPRAGLVGYASSLYLFAKVARQHGIDDIRFKFAISWGDKIFPHYRALIKQQFDVDVHDTYACSEGFMIAAQCGELNYHMMSPQVYIELLDKQLQPVAPGELGYVVATRLDGFAMPLIRYYLGDIAVRAETGAQCRCGRELPLLARIIGRDTDIVRTASGKYMVVHSFTGIFEHIVEIAQFQVIQRQLTGIEIEYIPAAGFKTEVLERARAQILGYLKEEFRIDFREVHEIAPTPSGKPQIIRSLIEGDVGLTSNQA